jgi:glycosyltransferase involved in cell wall biosynthesis
MNRICSTLADAGANVWLIGRSRKDSIALTDKSYQQKRLNCFFQTGKLFYAEFNIRLFFYLIFQSFDKLCSIDLDTVLPGLAVCKLKHKTHFYDAHEMFPYVPEVISRPTIQKFWMWVEQLTFKHTNKVYTVGGAIADWFQNKYNKQVSVVRNMPIISEITDSCDIDLPNEPFILYQGALNEGRGLEILFDVLVDTNYHLVIVGDGDLSSMLKRRTKELKLENQVHFIGFVVPLKLPSITKRAFVGYNVSENLGLSYYYSLNNKFFDYVASELPSLVNDFPEYTKLLADFKVGLPTPYNVNEIRENLDNLYSNKITYDSLKEQCQLAKQVWNWEMESQRLIDIYF